MDYGYMDVFLKADVHLDDGSYVRAAVPSGASTGMFYLLKIAPILRSLWFLNGIHCFVR